MLSCARENRKNKGVLNSKEKSYLRNMRSMENNKRSQSGPKSQQNLPEGKKLRVKNKKSSNSNVFKKQNFINNGMDFDFLTKTVGCMPNTATGGKQISDCKQKPDKKKNKKSSCDQSGAKGSTGQSLSKINYSAFKSFHDSIVPVNKNLQQNSNQKNK